MVASTAVENVCWRSRVCRVLTYCCRARSVRPSSRKTAHANTHHALSPWCPLPIAPVKSTVGNVATHGCANVCQRRIWKGACHEQIIKREESIFFLASGRRRLYMSEIYTHKDDFPYLPFRPFVFAYHFLQAGLRSQRGQNVSPIRGRPVQEV